MKRYILLMTLLALFSSINAQYTWYEQNLNTNHILFDIQFIDENIGWLCGNNARVYYTTDGGSNWTQQTTPPNNTYWSLFFINDQKGWVTADAGKLMSTTDGGTTWSAQTISTHTMYDAYFVDENNGWAVGGTFGGYPSFHPKRVILNTTDGGSSWSTQYYGYDETVLKSVYFVDVNSGWAVGESGAVLHTSDGGNNWDYQMSTNSYHMYDVFFLNANLGYVVGQYLGLPHVPGIFRTTDGGINWDLQTFGQGEGLSSIYFIDEHNGWAVGGNNSSALIMRTTDGGNNWFYENIGIGTSLTCVMFIDENSGWAVGNLGTVLGTSATNPVELASFTATAVNNSVTLSWQTATETNNYGFEIQRLDPPMSYGHPLPGGELKGWVNIGFVEGAGSTSESQYYNYFDKNLDPGKYFYKLIQIDYDGTFHKSNIIEVDIESVITRYKLNQNYPNPFNPSTIISYSLPEDNFVDLKVFNAIGEEVATLTNEFKSAGSYDVTFDANNLSGGIYFYKIKAGSFNQVRKMIMVK